MYDRHIFLFTYLRLFFTANRHQYFTFSCMIFPSNDILKLPGGLLEKDVAVKLFDMKKFQQNVNREMKRQRPERNKLESQV
jgi:hypothetical protein